MKHLILFVVLAFSSAYTLAEKVVFAIGEWPPYVSSEMANYGYTTEIISAICREAGITPVYKFYPWARAQQLVQDGKVFGSFAYAINNARKSKYLISDVFQYGDNVFVYYDGNIKITDKIITSKDLNDLKSLSFGVALGDFMREEYEVRGLKHYEVKNTQQLIKMLKAKRIDMIVGDRASLYYEIKKAFPLDVAKFRALTFNYMNAMPNVLIASKKHPNSEQILARFNAGLKKILANGVYREIVNKNNIHGI